MYGWALLFSVVTGCGHIYLGRYVRGVLFFLAFAIGLNFLLLGALWNGEPTRTHFIWAGLSLSSLTWFGGYWDVYRLTFGRTLRERAAHRGRYLREGQKALEAGAHHRAIEAFARALEARPFEDDPEVYFALGKAYKVWGKERKARRWFRACIAADGVDGLWAREIERLENEHS